MENSAVTSAEALALSEELLSIGQENSLKRFYSIGEKSILENETWYEKEKQIWESVRGKINFFFNFLRIDCILLW